MPRYFVWEKGLLGPCAAIWHDKMTDGNGKDRATLLLIKLDDEDDRTLDQLIEAYPKPKAAET